MIRIALAAIATTILIFLGKIFPPSSPIEDSKLERRSPKECLRDGGIIVYNGNEIYQGIRGCLLPKNHDY